METDGRSISLWRLLIHLAFVTAVSIVAGDALGSLLRAYPWSVHHGASGRSFAGILGIAIGLGGGRLLDRVWPLLPGRR